ncbi:MAG: hypothetical protein IH624_07525 [Phycisphaerae bacterium]|nr:hypothetical protein [Phycisphaerae bacterium]
MAWHERFTRFGGTFGSGTIEATDPNSTKFFAQKGQEHLRSLAIGLLTDIEAVGHDARLSPVGKKERIQALAKTCLAAIEKDLDRFTGPLQKRIKQLEGMLVETHDVDLAGALELIGLRQLLMTLDPARINSIFLDSVKSRDAQTFRAIVGLPSWANPLSPRAIEEGKRLWAEGINPSAAAELRDLSHANDVLAGSLSELRQGITELAELQPDTRSRLTGNQNSAA